ncbi:DNA primase [Muribaculaceae bacterium Isolate-039 (Harlan)]|uniref:DNA primase n=3 Tax=Muribaculaceae TaxID=2005473 RepID=A0A2V1IQ80_9BACT|nr:MULTISPECIES: toprim domain-containing protein [Bacteroidales]ROS86211.1 DNA primase [Muribaculaceae bacterium Isolate-039 (Harlan)]ROS89484.1 DNA primase [Muribaculaceae bacterium Isolate-043 (Harlan)]MYM13585.1 DNA primase [Muribaculum intestinale]PWB06566.1 DNA primase [Paramuribaculum intestinale]PWB10892.1 DNA primase [Paramuribaculum intestinale]
MNIDDIRKISLVEFLNQLGYQPTGRDSKGLWFYAPYRSERKPSFHVNPNRQVWFDFGTGAGGDIFSLAREMSGETDFLRQADYIAEKMRLPVAKPYKPTPFVEEPTFENVEVSRLESHVLLRYLADRGIPKEIAQRYCVQVDYELHGKRYYAVGFPNNANGLELRNPFFKGSYPPKHITHIANDNARCNVFEGFIDFLSAERLGYNEGLDTIVLNSVANLQKAITPLGDYTVIQCYLDNDTAGRAALARLQREFGDKVMDKSALYPNHKDLNDYLMSLYPTKSNKVKL